MNAADLINRELEKGVSRREIARRCGVSLGTIQNILLGDTEIKNSTLEKISDYFKVQIEYAKSPAAVHSIREAQAGGYTHHHVIADVGAILESGNTEIINALVSNVREFKRAVVQQKKLNVCEVELDEVRQELKDLRRQVDRLSSTEPGAGAPGASSGGAGT